MKIIFYDGFQQLEGVFNVSHPYRLSLHSGVFKPYEFLHSVLTFNSLIVCQHNLVLSPEFANTLSVLDMWQYHVT